MILLTNFKNARYGPTVQFPNNKTMIVTRTGNTPLSSSLITHTKKVHIFDGKPSASLISLGQLCDYDCVAIFDKNEINIIKVKTLILKGQRSKIYGL